MPDTFAAPTSGGPVTEQRIGSFFEALKALKSAEELASQPLGKGDPLLAAKIKELKGYVDVFLKAEIGRKPRFVVLDRKTASGLTMAVDLVFKDAVQLYDGLSLSLSKGGLFIKTEALLPIDTILTLSCRLETENVSFKVAGKVIWINPRESQGRPQGMGIKLHKLSSVQRQVLDTFMAGELPAAGLEHLGE